MWPSSRTWICQITCRRTRAPLKSNTRPWLDWAPLKTAWAGWARPLTSCPAHFTGDLDHPCMPRPSQPALEAQDCWAHFAINLYPCFNLKSPRRYAIPPVLHPRCARTTRDPESYREKFVESITFCLLSLTHFYSLFMFGGWTKDPRILRSFVT